MAAEQHERSEPETRRTRDEARVWDALTNLSAYALGLDSECHRLDDCLTELTNMDSSVAERRALQRERDELADEVKAFRRAITTLREEVAVGGDTSVVLER